MKLTKQILAKLIKEEYNSFLTEDDVQRISYKALFDLEKKLTSDIKKQEKELNKKTDAYNKLEDRLKSTLERLEEERNDLYNDMESDPDIIDDLDSELSYDTAQEYGDKLSRIDSKIDLHRKNLKQKRDEINALRSELGKLYFKRQNIIKTNRDSFTTK